MTTRRIFINKLGLAAGLTTIRGDVLFSDGPQKTIKPKALKTGDTIGVISPSGAVFESEPYVMTREVLERLGFNVVMGKHAHDRYGHLAGNDLDRAADINEMFQREDVQGIFCLRGGSGAARILDQLDYKMIAKNPKVFMGYSDITAFLLAIYSQTGMVTFHGPVTTSDWNEFSLYYFREILLKGKTPVMKNPGKRESELIQTHDRIRTIHSGKATGILAGGNLSVLSGIVGSRYLPDWKGKLLFLEDVGEEIHRIDRMMSQLQLAGILDQISGFIFGKCSNCEPESSYGSLTFEEVIDHYIQPLKIPAYSGAMIGHISNKFTVPVGIRALIDADNGTISLEEPAVIGNP